MMNHIVNENHNDNVLKGCSVVSAQSSNQIEKTILTEWESKKILSEFGIPVVDEILAYQQKDVIDAARRIKFPVVLKAHGKSFLHKTEAGLVHINLTNQTLLEKAIKSIQSSAKDTLEGFLVQPYIPGRREFVAGLFQDPQFGPVVMFGVGGIFTEAFADITFRLAPLSNADAYEMIEEIRASRLLNDFRNEKAVDRDQIVQTLIGLSQIAMSHPEITEIDINPLKATPDGKIVAVDALIVKHPQSQAKEFPPSVDSILIGKLFHPKSIAFVGATSQMGKWGHLLLSILISEGYKGDIYFVNPKGGTIAGRPVFKTVKDIPGHIDLAVVTIPAEKVIDLIPQFSEKNIRNMVLISSGFAETGDKGKRLEAELIASARQAGILIVGPNTMGICNPHIRLYCTGSHVKPIAGSTTVISQSGNMGTQLLAFAEQQGIGIRVFSGSGNEGMITIEDYLEGCEIDKLTHQIVFYIESVKNGRRFFEAARRTSLKKPIILLKGGRTGPGSRAAATHTGAMTTDERVFHAVCKQAGIVKVELPMDLLDLAAAFSALPLPEGNRAAIITLGGGWGVVTADLCHEYGLTVPELHPDIVERINLLLPPYWSRTNPVDIVGETDEALPIIIMEELLKWDGCDAVINLGIKGRRNLVGRYLDSVKKADPTYQEEFLENIHKELAESENRYIKKVVELMEKYQKPIYGVSILSTEKDQTVFHVEGSRLKGLFYPTPERAVKAFSKMYAYRKYLKMAGVTLHTHSQNG